MREIERATFEWHRKDLEKTCRRTGAVIRHQFLILQ